MPSKKRIRTSYVMDYMRLSNLLSSVDAAFSSEDEASIQDRDRQAQVDVELMSSRRAFCINKCLQIFPLLVDKEFGAKYWTLPTGIPDCYVFSHASTRCLIIEAVTRFHESQADNLHSYQFAAHPLFEAKVSAYTRWKGQGKPNLNLVRSRNWDVALNVVMKIEALMQPYDKNRYLLRREHSILQHLWDTYLSKSTDVDEMTGIPMVFEFVEVPNHTFCVLPDGHRVDEIDEFGKTRQMLFALGSKSRSTLSYMTLEKLGPSVAYLQELVRATQSTFDLYTALKIFDQLLCRILQLHRFRVVHNDICPENVYMGRGVTFNVVYLNSFKQAYRIEEGDKQGPTGLAAGPFSGCNVRFAPANQLSSGARLMRPIDDVESAFYVLVALLGADILPWDAFLPKAESLNNVAMSSSFDELSSQNNTVEDLARQTDPEQLPTETLRKIQECKQRFWQSNQQLNMVVANAICQFGSDDYQASAAESVLRDVYLKVMDWRQNFMCGEECHNYCTRLARSSSGEFRQFMELRKCALIHFQFSETFDIINDITFRKKVDHMLQKGSLQQKPWNVIVWCFNNIEIKPASKWPSSSPEGGTFQRNARGRHNAVSLSLAL